MKVDVKHWRVLVALWTFALGIALSYKPPYMAAAPIEAPTVPTVFRRATKVTCGQFKMGGTARVVCIEQEVNDAPKRNRR
jgi:hypothetical protein